MLSNSSLAAFLHIVKHVGAIVGSLLRLDLPGLINAVLHLLIDAGILIVDALRTVLLGFFIGHIVENFDRNSLRRFVGRLLGNTFAEPRLTQVRNALCMSDPLWGLRPHVTHKTLVMESPAMPLAVCTGTARSTCSRWPESCRSIHSGSSNRASPSMARQERQRVHLSGIPLPHRQGPRRRPAQSPDLRADRVRAERPNSVCDQALQRHGHQADVESFHHRAPADAACDA